MKVRLWHRWLMFDGDEFLSGHLTRLGARLQRAGRRAARRRQGMRAAAFQVVHRDWRYWV